MPSEKKQTGYPSIDKPWLRFYDDKKQMISLAKGSYFDQLWRYNQDHLNELALIYFGHKISYKLLFENVQLVRDAFLNYGVKKGDRVVLFTSSVPETVYSLLALCRIGAVANMINPLFDEEQIVERVNETEAELMIVLEPLFSKIMPIMGDLCVKKYVVVPISNSMPIGLKIIAKSKEKKYQTEKIISWVSFIKDAKNNLPDAEYESGRALVMVYSSGTTGASKGIVLTNDGVNSTLANYFRNDYFPHRRGETYLQMIPVWFSTGIILSILMPMCVGVTVILEPVFSKESFARDIKRYKPNLTLAATSLWLYASQSKELRNADLSSMHYPITGGEQLLPRVEIAINRFLRERGCKSPLLQGYGMCELGGTVTTASLLHPRIGATGYPLMGVVVAAFDEETGAEMKFGERGELRVSSPNSMKEYYKNPEATKQFFWKDEKGTVWGRTGDMGYVDSDGFVYVLGRTNDCFTAASGKRFYCFDIENVILRSPEIAQCEVIAISCKDGTNVTAAQIVLEPSCKQKTLELLESVHKACVNDLEGECVPKGYKIVDSFPVKNNGKRDMEIIKSDLSGYLMPMEGVLKNVEFSE